MAYRDDEEEKKGKERGGSSSGGSSSGGSSRGGFDDPVWSYQAPKRTDTAEHAAHPERRLFNPKQTAMTSVRQNQYQRLLNGAHVDIFGGAKTLMTRGSSAWNEVNKRMQSGAGTGTGLTRSTGSGSGSALTRTGSGQNAAAYNQPANATQKLAASAATQYGLTGLTGLTAQPDITSDGKWWAGETPTDIEAGARIMALNGGGEMLSQLGAERVTKGSSFYRPTAGITSPAVAQLAALGVEVPAGGLTDEWFQRNSFLQQYYTPSRNSTTGAPKAPGKRASLEEKLGYWYYQAYGDLQQTQAAETEMAALREEVGYWANNPRGYSDEEVAAHIDWSKYPTLRKIDQGGKDGVPVSLVRGLDWSMDYLPGLIWSARNGGGTGDAYSDAVFQRMGAGNGYTPDAETREKLDHTSPKYAPYSVGATGRGMEKAGMYFGTYSFDKDWLTKNRGYAESTNPDTRAMYTAVYNAEKFTSSCESEREALYAFIDENSAHYDPDMLLQMIDESDDYKHLRRLDESMESGLLEDTTRAIDYRRADMESYIRAKYAARQAETPPTKKARETKNWFQRATDWVGEQWDNLTGGPANDAVAQYNADMAGQDSLGMGGLVPVTPSSETQDALDDAARANAAAAAPIIGAAGTPGEKRQTQYGDPTQDKAADDLGALVTGGLPAGAGGQLSQEALDKGIDGEEYLGHADVIQKWDDLQQQDTDLRTRLQEIRDGRKGKQPDAAPAETDEADKPTVTGRSLDDFVVSSTLVASATVSDTIPPIATAGANKPATEMSIDETIDWLYDASEEAKRNGDTDLADGMYALWEDLNDSQLWDYENDPTAADKRDILLQAAAWFRNPEDASTSPIVAYYRNKAILEAAKLNPELTGASYDEARAWMDRMNSIMPGTAGKTREQADAIDEAWTYFQEADIQGQLYAINYEKGIIKPSYDGANDYMTALARQYDDSELTWQITGEGGNRQVSAADALNFAAGFIHYTPFQYLDKSLYDVAIEDGLADENGQIVHYTPKQAMEFAQERAAKLDATIESIDMTLAAFEQNGIKVSPEVLRHMRQARAFCEIGKQEALYYRLSGNKDFESVVTKATAEAKPPQPDSSRYEWFPENEDFSQYSQLALAATEITGKHPSQFNGWREDEIKRLIYLAKNPKGSQRAAMDYYTFMTDEYGVVTTRVGREKEQTETQRLRTLDKWTFNTGGTIASILMHPAQYAGGIYTISNFLQGKTANPYHWSLAYGKASQAEREAVKTELTGLATDFCKNQLGWDPNSAKSKFIVGLSGMGYDAYTSYGDSLIDAAIASALGLNTVFGAENAADGVIASIAKHIGNGTVGALPMAVNAGAMTYAEVIGRGGEPWQAYAMMGATIACESVSEGIELTAITGAFGKGAEEGVRSIRELLADALLESGNELIAEGANEWLEEQADAFIMGELSNHKQTVDALMRTGDYKTREDAELAYADQLRHRIATAAITGAMSGFFGTAGTQVLGATLGQRLQGEQTNWQEMLESSRSFDPYYDFDMYQFANAEYYQRLANGFRSAGYSLSAADMMAQAMARSDFDAYQATRENAPGLGEEGTSLATDNGNAAQEEAETPAAPAANANTKGGERLTPEQMAAAPEAARMEEGAQPAEETPAAQPTADENAEAGAAAMAEIDAALNADVETEAPAAEPAPEQTETPAAEQTEQPAPAQRPAGITVVSAIGQDGKPQDRTGIVPGTAAAGQQLGIDVDGMVQRGAEASQARADQVNEAVDAARTAAEDAGQVESPDTPATPAEVTAEAEQADADDAAAAESANAEQAAAEAAAAQPEEPRTSPRQNEIDQMERAVPEGAATRPVAKRRAFFGDSNLYGMNGTDLRALVRDAGADMRRALGEGQGSDVTGLRNIWPRLIALPQQAYQYLDEYTRLTGNIEMDVRTGLFGRTSGGGLVHDYLTYMAGAEFAEKKGDRREAAKKRRNAAKTLALLSGYLQSRGDSVQNYAWLTDHEAMVMLRQGITARDVVAEKLQGKRFILTEKAAPAETAAEPVNKAPAEPAAAPEEAAPVAETPAETAPVEEAAPVQEEAPAEEAVPVTAQEEAPAEAPVETAEEAAAPAAETAGEAAPETPAAQPEPAAPVQRGPILPETNQVPTAEAEDTRTDEEITNNPSNPFSQAAVNEREELDSLGAAAALLFNARGSGDVNQTTALYGVFKSQVQNPDAITNGGNQAAAMAMMSRFKGEKALNTMRGVLLEAKRSGISMADALHAIQVASLTDGKAAEVLGTIAGTRATADRVNRLMQAAAQDEQTYAEQLQSKAYDGMIERRKQELMGQGMANAARETARAVQSAMAAVNEAGKQVKTAERNLTAAEQAFAAASELYDQNKGDGNEARKGAASRAVGAANAALEAAQRNLEKAKADAKLAQDRHRETRDEVLTQIRQQATADVQAEIEQTNADREARRQAEEARENAKSGKSGQMYADGKTPVAFHYVLMDQAGLIASNDTDGRVNPEYPADLQPRDRTRMANRTDVDSIARSLTPALLGENPRTTDGAPVIGPDFVVESGNGRTMAIRQAMEQGLDSAKNYTAWLRENADKFGFTPEDITPSSVLVRMRDGEVDRRQFVQQSNQQTVSAMSQSETAQMDAGNLTSHILNLYNTEAPGILSPSNAEFVRAFMAMIPASQQGLYSQANGQINLEGEKRMENALFQAAYGSISLTNAIAENPNPEVKNVFNGLTNLAAKLAVYNRAVQDGTRYDLGIAEAITQAAEQYRKLKRDGESVQEYIGQVTMPGMDDTSDAAKLIMQMFEDNARSGKKITQYLTDLLEHAEILGDPSNTTMEKRTVPELTQFIRDSFAETEAKLEGVQRAMFNLDELDNIAKNALDGYIARQGLQLTPEEYQQEFDRWREEMRQQAEQRQAMQSDMNRRTENERRQDMRRFAEDFTNSLGIHIKFRDGSGRDGSGIVWDGMYVRGEHRVYIDSNMTDTQLFYSTLAHECMHSVEESGHYQQLQDILLSQRYGTTFREFQRNRENGRMTETDMQLQADLQEIIDRYAPVWTRDGFAREYWEAEALHELTADHAIDMFQNEDMIRDFVQQDRSLAQRIHDWIVSVIQKLTGYNTEPLERARDLFARAIAEEAKKNAWRTREAEAREAQQGTQEQRTQRALQGDLEASDGTETHYGDRAQFSLRVTDPTELDFLNGQQTVRTFKTMQYIDGQLYPPMAAVVSKDAGKEDYSILGQWEKSTEHPELIKFVDGKPKFVLIKGDGSSIEAAYNPYMHSSNLMLNDQFSGAYARPNLVTVECEVPVSELDSGYRAEYAKDAVGWHSWHTGTVASKIRKAKNFERQVFLSRWIKPVRIVPEAEVAQHYADLLSGTDVAVPDKVVPPALLDALREAGVPIEVTGRVTEASRQRYEEYRRAVESGDTETTHTLTEEAIAEQEAAEEAERLEAEQATGTETEPGTQFSLRRDTRPDYQSRAYLKESTIDRWLQDYAASNPEYAQAYITYMNPADFLGMTTPDLDGRMAIRENTSDLDVGRMQEISPEQPMFFRIGENGKIEGHEGRHRAEALAKAGITRMPVLIFDSSNKYSKTPQAEMTLTGQDHNDTVNDRTLTLQDVLPFSRGNRAEIMDRFMPGTMARASERAGSPMVQYSQRGQDTRPGWLRVQQDNTVHGPARQFSVTQGTEAAGLHIEYASDSGHLFNITYTDAQGNERTAEMPFRVYDDNGNTITECTPEILEHSPMGRLIQAAIRIGTLDANQTVNYTTRDANGNEVTEQISYPEALKRGFSTLMTMAWRYGDGGDMVWEIASAVMFSSRKNNSDAQYSSTIDFGTVCTKTQAIVDLLSQRMKEKGRGLSRKEVLDVYHEAANEGLDVPCPVCYVFSRWMGVPSLLGRIANYQKSFGTMTQEQVDTYVRRIKERYTDTNPDPTKRKTLSQMLSASKTKLGDHMDKLYAAWESAKTDAERDRIARAMDEVEAEYSEIDAYNWVTQVLCKETRKGSGKYVLDRSYRPVPNEVLFDLNRSGRFATDYPKTWRYRNTRGAGMGKSIMEYGGFQFGDTMKPMGKEAQKRWTKRGNPLFSGKDHLVDKYLRNARIRAMAQNLIGGQRYQSTSDFRPEWGLDYYMSLMECQMTGSKVQLYTKVIEAVDMFARANCETNLSLMGKGKGWHEATQEEIAVAQTMMDAWQQQMEEWRQAKAEAEQNGEEAPRRPPAPQLDTVQLKDGRWITLDFSDVTGIDPKKAKEKIAQYDNVQGILVGMNKEHVLAAMASKWIQFIIPWHASGNSTAVLSKMLKAVREVLDPKDASDWTKQQTDKPLANRTEAQQAAWDVRMALLTGELWKGGKPAPTAEQMAVIEANPYLQDLYRRFYLDESETDTYGVKLNEKQAGQIFPYEYWDTSTTIDTADVNGQRFLEYCESLGMQPRFQMFSEYTGYWKLLIDRCMYNNDGTYHTPKTIDVTGIRPGDIATKVGRHSYGDQTRYDRVQARLDANEEAANNAKALAQSESDSFMESIQAANEETFGGETVENPEAPDPIGPAAQYSIPSNMDEVRRQQVRSALDDHVARRTRGEETLRREAEAREAGLRVEDTLSMEPPRARVDLRPGTLATRLFDRTHPLFRMTQAAMQEQQRTIDELKAKRKSGEKLTAGERAIIRSGVQGYDSSRDVRDLVLAKDNAIANSTDFCLTRHMVDPRGNRVYAEDGSRVGSLADILQKVNSRDEKAFNAYWLALYMKERQAAGREVTRDLTDTAEMDRTIAEAEAAHPDWRGIVDEACGWYGQFMQTWLVNEGLVRQSTLDTFRQMYPHYVPTFSAELTESAAQKRNRGRQRAQHLSRAGEGAGSILNPVMGMAEKVQTMIATAKQAEVMRAFGDFFSSKTGQDMGLVQELDPTPATQEHGAGIGAMEAMSTFQWVTVDPATRREILHVPQADGSVRNFVCHDPGIITALVGTQQNGKGLQAFARVTGFVCAMATAKNLAFALQNFASDGMTAMITGNTHGNVLTYNIQRLASMFDLGVQHARDAMGMQTSERYQKYQLYGGMGSRYAMRETNVSRAFRDKLYHKDVNVLRGFAEFVGDVLRFEHVEALANLLEETTRYNEFVHGHHDLTSYEGLLKAAKASREVTTDFSKSGDWKAVRYAGQLVPFIRAQLQGTYKSMRMFSGENAGNRGRYMRRIVFNTLLSAAVLAALRGIDWDDDELKAYEEMSPYERVKYAHVKIGGKIVRVKRTQDGILGFANAVGDMIGDLTNGYEDDDFAQFADCIHEVAMNMLPNHDTVFEPFLDASNNQTWYGSPIEGSQFDGMAEQDKYTSDTWPVYRWASNLSNLVGIEYSPLDWQYIAQQYTGSAGRIYAGLGQQLINGDLNLEDAIGMAGDEVFGRMTYDPVYSSYASSTFYDGLDALAGIKATNDQIGQPGHLLRADITPQEHQMALREIDTMTKKGGSLYMIKKSLKSLWKQYNAIGTDGLMSDEEAEEARRNVRRQINEQARRGNAIISGFMARYGRKNLRQQTADRMLRLIDGE